MVLSAPVCTGHGINCEKETQYALEIAGFDRVDLIHLNFLAGIARELNRYQIIVIPGGFLDGDDLGAAQACANRIKYTHVDNCSLLDLFIEFVQGGGLVLGICNGFQLIAKLGMLPGFDGCYTDRGMTLTHNDSGRFEDRWVRLVIDSKSPCVFTKGIETMYLPVRHGEGKILCRDTEYRDRLLSDHQAVMRYISRDAGAPTMTYPYNPNGSLNAVAGVCDSTGRVFGLMPHPEYYVHRTHHPRWTREDLPEDGDGLAIFKNALNFIKDVKKA